MPTIEHRYITVWRKPAPDSFEWDFYVSQSREEASNVVANIIPRGVKQFTTYPIGEADVELSEKVNL